MMQKYTKQDLLNILNEYGYSLLFDIDYQNVKQNIHCVDKNGYKGITTLDRLINKKSPFTIFHKKNPYSIENIHNYIKINNLNCTLLSTEFNGRKEYIELLCYCGKSYKIIFDNFLSTNQDICYDCKKPKSDKSEDKTQTNTRKTYEDFVKLAKQKGYDVVSSKDEYHTTKTKMTLTDGIYLYSTTYDGLKYKKNPIPFHNTNPYTIHNINVYLKLYKDDNFYCTSNIYTNERSDLDFVCKRCKTSFKMKWINAYRKGKSRNGITCEKCDGRIESLHACVLKQVFMHEYPDTVLEDNSCINPITSCILPTDIVNHRLKIAIEIQSQYHDYEYQIIKDTIKKEFWLEKGYSFYSPDIRAYNIIEMIQIFFPAINEIPEYIDFTYSNKLNIVEIQKYLDKDYSPNDISTILNINIHRIYDAIYNKKLFYSDTYTRNDYSPVVQLTTDGEYVNEYNNIVIASSESKVSYGNIVSCLNSKKNYSGGFLWFYKKDYYSDNFKIPPKTRRRKEDFEIAVEKYDLNWNYIQTYKNIDVAAKENNTKKVRILDVIEGKRRKCANFYWKIAS